MSTFLKSVTGQRIFPKILPMIESTETNEETSQLGSTFRANSFFKRIELWANTNTISPMPIGTACCSFEYISACGPRYQMDRFIPALLQVDPSESDLLIISGPITTKMLPYLLRIYEKMVSPKWVIALGACTSCGGPFNGPNIIHSIEKYINIDLFIPGCPPSPQSIIEGVLTLKEKIKAEL
ncbi:MAG: NADH-quinone oxidoreductase subunit NuoB [Halobacteriovoraceae bacterium]|nr:NADH-quinone oxidoreductase subunit NuoB [Halobacteriovoraceae bacterium]